MNVLKRKRSRVACKPCRERKRRCDGDDPCLACTEWGYECHYEARPRKSRAAAAAAAAATVTQATPDSLSGRPPSSQPEPTGVLPPAGSSTAAASEQRGLVRHLEANSGAAFVRKLGLKIDPTKAPKVNLFGWNIGARQLSTHLDAAAPALPVTEITSAAHLASLAQVYFDKVDPCYGFMDRDQFFQRLDERWRSPPTSTVYDSVLAGVGAIGCLFSQRIATITELHLVRSARASLDSHHLSGPPSIDLLTGWALRVVYLRETDSPHATWIASSALMHLVEASGLHPDSPSVLMPSAQCDPDLKRRIVGVAHHLNAWASFDLGLSRVSFQKHDLPPLPAPKPGDYTAELLGLLPVSVSLDPGRLKDETDLTSTLSQILNGTHSQPPSVLAQCNLVLCVLRRIQTQNLDLPSGLAEQVLALFDKALGCARAMVLECSPWHQVANVPFHITCVLLAMDTRSSLAMLPRAMQTLSLVASAYNTETMRDAYSTAYLLVLLHQQRRKDDMAIFGEALNMPPPEGDNVTPPQTHTSAEDHSWLEALVADWPGLQGVDMDQFLNTNIE